MLSTYIRYTILVSTFYKLNQYWVNSWLDINVPWRIESTISHMLEIIPQPQSQQDS